MRSSHPPASILWRQVWGLVAMLVAILIGFRAYELYQPSILTNLGFVQLVGVLGIVQGLLGMVVEPVVGGFSDRLLRRLGSRLPQVTVGVTLAGLIFIGVAFLVQNYWLAGIRWLVPVLMLIWLMAMIAVRGPVVAMLRQFAPVDQLPHANALLILVLGLVGALNPLLELTFKQVGTSSTFVLGAICLLIGSLILFTSVPGHHLTFATPDERRPVPHLLLGLIFIIGVEISLIMGLVMATVPKLLQAQLPGIPLQWLISGILFVSAVSANPFARVTTRLGAARSLQHGSIVLVMVLGLALISQTSVIAVDLLLLLGLGMGLLLISIVPFALAGVPIAKVGLSTGLYFGGSGLAGAIVAFLSYSPDGIHPTTAFLWAALCSALTVPCLNLTRRLTES